MKQDRLGILAGVVFGLGIACTHEVPSPETAAAASALEGTYDFDLASSDVAGRVRAACDAEGAGDAAKTAACNHDADEEARTEKIRFAKDAEGRLVWTSFGTKEAKERIFVQVPLTVTTFSERSLTAKAVGIPSGTLVGQATHLRKELRIETPADGSIVIVDGEKGRLVYRRAR
jgi:hypothetical protein